MNYINDKVYSKEEKELLWKDIYQHELNSYIKNQGLRFLHLNIDSMTVDYITELIFNEYPLSKAFALIYFTVNSTMRYIKKYNPKKRISILISEIKYQNL